MKTLYADQRPSPRRGSFDTLEEGATTRTNGGRLDRISSFNSLPAEAEDTKKQVRWRDEVHGSITSSESSSDDFSSSQEGGSHGSCRVGRGQGVEKLILDALESDKGNVPKDGIEGGDRKLGHCAHSSSDKSISNSSCRWDRLPPPPPPPPPAREDKREGENSIPEQHVLETPHKNIISSDNSTGGATLPTSMETKMNLHNEEPLPSAVDLMSNVKHFLQELGVDEEDDSSRASTPLMSNVENFLQELGVEEEDDSTRAPTPLMSNVKHFLHELGVEEEDDSTDSVAEDVKAWYSELCQKKSEKSSKRDRGISSAAKGETMETISEELSQDEVIRRVRAFKKKRLRRLESIERVNAKETIGDSKTSTGGKQSREDKSNRSLTVPPPPPQLSGTNNVDCEEGATGDDGSKLKSKHAEEKIGDRKTSTGGKQSREDKSNRSLTVLPPPPQLSGTNNVDSDEGTTADGDSKLKSKHAEEKIGDSKTSTGGKQSREDKSNRSLTVPPPPPQLSGTNDVDSDEGTTTDGDSKLESKQSQRRPPPPPPPRPSIDSSMSDDESKSKQDNRATTPPPGRVLNDSNKGSKSPTPREIMELLCSTTPRANSDSRDPRSSRARDRSSTSLPPLPLRPRPSEQAAANQNEDRDECSRKKHSGQRPLPPPPRSQGANSNLENSDCEGKARSRRSHAPPPKSRDQGLHDSCPSQTSIRNSLHADCEVETNDTRSRTSNDKRSRSLPPPPPPPRRIIDLLPPSLQSKNGIVPYCDNESNGKLRDGGNGQKYPPPPFETLEINTADDRDVKSKRNRAGSLERSSGRRPDPPPPPNTHRNSDMTGTASATAPGYSITRSIDSMPYSTQQGSGWLPPPPPRLPSHPVLTESTDIMPLARQDSRTLPPPPPRCLSSLLQPTPPLRSNGADPRAIPSYPATGSTDSMPLARSDGNRQPPPPPPRCLSCSPPPVNRTQYSMQSRSGSLPPPPRPQGGRLVEGGPVLGHDRDIPPKVCMPPHPPRRQSSNLSSASNEIRNETPDNSNGGRNSFKTPWFGRSHDETEEKETTVLPLKGPRVGWDSDSDPEEMSAVLLGSMTKGCAGQRDDDSVESSTSSSSSISSSSSTSSSSELSLDAEEEEMLIESRRDDHFNEKQSALQYTDDFCENVHRSMENSSHRNSSINDGQEDLRRKASRLPCGERNNVVIVRVSLFVGGAVFLLFCVFSYANLRTDGNENSFLRPGKDDNSTVSMTAKQDHVDVAHSADSTSLIDSSSESVENNGLSGTAIHPSTASTSYVLKSLTTAIDDNLATQKGKSYGILFDVETSPSSPLVTIAGMDLSLVDNTILPTHYEIWTKAGSWQDGIAIQPADFLSGFRQVSQGVISGKGGAGASDDFTIMSVRDFQDVEIPRGGTRQAFYVTLSDDLLLFESYHGGEREDGGAVIVGRNEMVNMVQASNDALRVYYGAAVRTYPLELADPTTDFWDNAGFLGRIWMK